MPFHRWLIPVSADSLKRRKFFLQLTTLVITMFVLLQEKSVNNPPTATPGMLSKNMIHMWNKP